jgi:hypothetical protein
VFIAVYDYSFQNDSSADVRAVEKVIHSSPGSEHAKDVAKSPSNVASVCVLEKEHPYSYLYKLHSHVGTQRLRFKPNA